MTGVLMLTTTDTRQTLDLWPDVGTALGVSRGATYKAARLKQIPTLRIGRRLVVPRSAFEALLAGTWQQPESTPAGSGTDRPPAA